MKVTLLRLFRDREVLFYFTNRPIWWRWRESNPRAQHSYTVCVTISPPYKAKSCGMSLPALHVCSPNSSRSLSLQYRSYLRPTNRWHYGSVDYLDPLCTTALYFTFAGLALHKYTLCRHIMSRLVTPPSLRLYLLLLQRSLRVHRLYRGH